MNLYGKTGTRSFNMITATDFLRYSRQMLLEEVGTEGQLKIKTAKVLVVGTGGLGSPVLTYLAAAGVGHLATVDFDSVETHNLHRQILFTETNVGKLKTEGAWKRISELNPHISFHSFSEKLTADNISRILNDYDIVVDGSDNFTTRYLINDYCVEKGKTVIYGSILGFQGQLAVFNHKGSKHLRDIFPEPPMPEQAPNCSENGVLGTFPGIIGTMMAQETLKVILGMPVLTNSLLLLDTKTWEFTKLRF